MIIIKKGKVVFMTNPELSSVAVDVFCLFLSLFHTCHKLLTVQICEIRQMFKGDLIQFCESLTKITLKLPENSQNPLMYEACDKHNKV